MLKRMLLCVGLFVCTFSVYAVNAVPVEMATQAWGSALSSNNPKKITVMYADGALLYATFENQLDTPEGIEGYFAKLMKHQDLAVKFTKQNIRMFGETAVNSGFYTFSYMDHGHEVSVPARYTFVFTHEGKDWLIVDHHSSVLPK